MRACTHRARAPRCGHLVARRQVVAEPPASTGADTDDWMWRRGADQPPDALLSSSAVGSNGARRPWRRATGDGGSGADGHRGAVSRDEVGEGKRGKGKGGGREPRTIDATASAPASSLRGSLGPRASAHRERPMHRDPACLHGRPATMAAAMAASAASVLLGRVARRVSRSAAVLSS